MGTFATALTAYESLALAYDDFTAHHDYELWLDLLEGLALDHGLAGREALDVACGTGKSFVPLLGRGYEVVACDLSPAMAAIAAAKAPEADVRVADMRDLSILGGRRFDLVTCLDDALNHLPDEASLRAAFRAAACALRPDGVYVFDVNTLRMFDEMWGRTWCQRTGDHMFVWEAQPFEGSGAGLRAHCALHVFRNKRDGALACTDTWTHADIRVSERHFPEPVIRAALAEAGLDCIGPFGMQTDASLYPEADEDRDTKAIYVARHRREGVN
jgi:SAM-dependent methyltransferase